MEESCSAVRKVITVNCRYMNRVAKFRKCPQTPCSSFKLSWWWSNRRWRQFSISRWRFNTLWTFLGNARCRSSSFWLTLRNCSWVRYWLFSVFFFFGVLLFYCNNFICGYIWCSWREIKVNSRSKLNFTMRISSLKGNQLPEVFFRYHKLSWFRGKNLWEMII